MAYLIVAVVVIGGGLLWLYLNGFDTLFEGWRAARGPRERRAYRVCAVLGPGIVGAALWVEYGVPPETKVFARVVWGAALLGYLAYFIWGTAAAQRQDERDGGR